MITLYGFGRIFPEGHGETKDLRAQWALEETGLPYRVHALDHAGGELDKDAHKLKTEVRKLAGRWLKDVERRLEDREWIACADFTVADNMMSCVLRSIRKTDLMEPSRGSRPTTSAVRPARPGSARSPSTPSDSA